MTDQTPPTTPPGGDLSAKLYGPRPLVRSAKPPREPGMLTGLGMFLFLAITLTVALLLGAIAAGVTPWQLP